MSRLLLVEDEDKLRNALCKGLSEEGLHVVAAADGLSGEQLARSGGFDCLILDLMLPGRGGLEILRSLRAAADWTPAIILTARRAVEDRVSGLDTGADDYLAKPFAFAELVARIRVCLRRRGASETMLLSGDLRLDLIHRRLFRDGKEIELTAREFSLLEVLVRRRNEVLTRETLAREVWRDPQAVLTNIIEVYVKYVRDKVESDGGPRRLRTVRGQGYCWVEGPEGEP